MDDESSDEDQALSDDSDCISDCSENLTEISNKIVANSQINVLNWRAKQCAIYFYYSMGGALAVCVISLADVHIRQMYIIQKHVIEYHDAIDDSFCSNCRNPLFFILPCNMICMPDLYTVKDIAE